MQVMSVYVSMAIFVFRYKISNYYWREYNGKIPNDAYAAGADLLGRATYIGLVLSRHGLLTGTIVPNYNYIVTTQATLVIPNDIKNTKILCSAEPGQLKWTKVGEDLLSDSCPFVYGGGEQDHVLHIGRINHEGETIVGIVYTDWDEWKGLWIVYNGKPVHFTSYEILTFNCKN
ncbi:hypothetical protein RI129_012944 [Pyrocoelia pectoralis]|uniref:Uncharacterized protein n=1 Tax=Pyrocoelia pectoralis TaxID=417401 RepID=A0AAN7V1Q8_9COLE